MHTPLALFKFAARALLNVLSGGIAGDFLCEVVPEMARDIWSDWGQDRDEQQRRDEVQALARAAAATVRAAVAAAVAETAAARPAPVREILTVYLLQLPATVRQALRRPSDPGGTTLPAACRLRSAEDLVALLPGRLPRFRPGDRPLPGVDWELVELLGIGGFGEVWKARNPHCDSVPPVALKFCVDPKAGDLLRHEAAVLNRVMRHDRHPGIVPLLHTYLEVEPVCLEYEYVAGGDLAGLIRDWHGGLAGPAPGLVEESARCVYNLAEVVAAAHRLDPPIVHRDLKPANILVQQLADGSRRLRVADFGSGGPAAGRVIEHTRHGLSHGRFLLTAVRGAHTPLYASPQQLRGEPPDPRDDVHALGVIWYQMLTGDLAAGRPGGTRWLQRLGEQGVPAALLEVMSRCFEEDPADRPADAGHLATELAAALQSPAATVVPPVFPSQESSSCRTALPSRPDGSGEPTYGNNASCRTALPSRPDGSGEPSYGNNFLAGVVTPRPAVRELPALHRLGGLRRLEGHTSSVDSVAFSPDGRWVLSGSADKTARLWDGESGQELRRFEGAGRWILSVAFSPDGRRAACGTWDKKVRVWNVLSEQEECCLRGHAGRVLSVSFSPDGRRVLSGGADHTIRLWDVSSGAELGRLSGHEDLVWSVAAFSRDGRRVLSASDDHTVRLWELTTGKELLRLGGHERPVLAVAFSADGRRALTGGWERAIQMWDVDSGQPVRTYVGHTDLVWSLALSPDGRRLLSGGADRSVRLWDVDSGQEMLRFEGHRGAVHGVAFAPDGRRAVSGGTDGSVRLWGLPG